jgi:signal transduction histidine kinase
VEFSIRFDGAVPERVNTDPLRLRQVLINLLSNAVKFTDRGGRVILRFSCEPTLHSSVVQFDVIDSGIGMDEAQMGRLFQPFMQGDQSTTRRFGGTGLGLSISRKLASLLGGDIVVQSTPGEGSTFSFWIDGGSLEGVSMIDSMSEAELETANAPEAPTAPTRLSGRVLLAEDGEDNRDLLCAILSAAGLQITCADNGRAAVEIAKAGGCDLVLMDMQMPELDGYTATRILRQGGYKKPIVALTANAMTDDRRRCLDAGCDEYCAKPVNREQLLTTIGRLLSGGQSQREDRPPVAAVGAALRSTRAGDPTLEKILPRFIERLPARVEELETLLDQGDLEGLRRAVHQIKGAAGGYGFPDLTTAAGDAETQLRAHAALDRIAVEVRELVETIRRVEGYPRLLHGDAVATRTESESPPLVQRGGRRRRPVLERTRTDPVSGLANRDYFRQCLTHEISRARRSGLQVGLIVIGMPHLSADESQYRSLAMIAAKTLTAGVPEALVGHWSVDRFVVACTGHTQEGLEAIATELVSQLRAASPNAEWAATVTQVTRSAVDAGDAVEAAGLGDAVNATAA